MNWNHSLQHFSRKNGITASSRLFLTFALFVFLTVCPPVANAQEHFRIDPSNSQVHFSLDATGHAVEGTFNISSGDITFNSANGAISGKVAVDATSGNSDNKSRDKKMTNDQLKAGNFPFITFTPTKYTGTLNSSGDSSIQVEGTFTLIGQSHTITVPMNVHREGSKCTASGSFTVPFVSWGVKDPSVMFLKVGKEVKVELKLAGTTGQ